MSGQRAAIAPGRMITSRLMRYGLAGGLSFLTHLVALVALVEWAGLHPVTATTLGFLASVVVSYLLQHLWVFRAGLRMREAFPRFLVVTAIGLGINSLIMGLGTRLAGQHYLLVQLAAWVAVPCSNYLLNRSWTFVEAGPGARLRSCEFVVLLAVTALWAAMGACAVVHLDFARDMMVAADILDGLDYPLLGPELAGSLHLGPIWYYLLALLQLFGGFWSVATLLALLGAAQFWFVYAVGRRIANRGTALLCVGLLLLPGWSTFELVLLTHPVLTASLVAGVVLAGVRFAQDGDGLSLTLMLLGFVLGLHAHPTVLVLVVLPMGFAWLGFARHGLVWRDAAIAGTVAALPLLPLFIDQLQSGWPILEGWAQFSGHQQSSGRIAAVAPLLQELVAGGARYWLSELAGFPDWSTVMIGVLLAILAVAGLAGALLRCRDGERTILVLLVALLVGLVGLSQVRAFYPYYMLSGVRVVLMLVTGLGLARLLPGTKGRRRGVLAVAGLGPLLLLSAFIPFAQKQRDGAWPFAFLPLMDVVSEPSVHQRHPFLAVRSTGQSGEWLCAQEEIVLHGSYALSVLHSYGAEARLQCGGKRLLVGGRKPGAEHVAGLSMALLREVAVEPFTIIGSFGLVPVEPLAGSGGPWPVGRERRYPPLPPDFGERTRREAAWSGRRDALVVVSDLSFGVAAPPDVSIDCNGSERRPLARDNVTWIYDVSGCEGGAVGITSATPEYIDVFVLDEPDG